MLISLDELEDRSYWVVCKQRGALGLYLGLYRFERWVACGLHVKVAKTGEEKTFGDCFLFFSSTVCFTCDF